MLLLAEFFTDYLAYLLFVFAVYKAFKTSNEKMILLPLIAAFLSSLVSGFTNHPRPFVALNQTPLVFHIADGSFPSDHASLVFSIALTQGSWLVWFLAWLVAIARVVTLLHWPFDILGSLALVFIVNYAYDLVEKYVKNRNKSASRSKTK